MAKKSHGLLCIYRREVEGILNDTTPLTVIRAKYKKERHAVCVYSQRLEISKLGFHHNLSYFMKGSKIEPKERGEWRKRQFLMLTLGTGWYIVETS
uniref:Lipocalin n=1 Tax=Rhipicephalus zambeziensis TaxID=60191 RepID=A0A224YMG1_9ACAR